MILTEQSNVNKLPLVQSKRIFPQDDFENFCRLHVNLLSFDMVL